MFEEPPVVAGRWRIPLHSSWETSCVSSDKWFGWLRCFEPQFLCEVRMVTVSNAQLCVRNLTINHIQSLPQSR